MLQNTPMNAHALGASPGASSKGTVTHIVAGQVTWMLFANCRLVMVHGYLWWPWKASMMPPITGVALLP